METKILTYLSYPDFRCYFTDFKVRVGCSPFGRSLDTALSQGVKMGLGVCANFRSLCQTQNKAHTSGQ